MENLNRYVIIPTHLDGVHVGVLKSYDATTRHADLTESRRIFSWQGAFTLSAIANDGIKAGRLSQAVPFTTLTEVLGITPCSEISENILRNFPVHLHE